MQIFRALAFEEFSTIESNVAFSIYPNYSEQNTYAADDRVRSGDFEYVALQTTTGNPPEGGSPNWLKIGYVNRLRIFDRRIYSTPIQKEGQTINYNLVPIGPVDSVALFAIMGDAVTVQVRKLTDDSLVWTKTIQLYNANQGDWYNHLFSFPLPEGVETDDLFRQKASVTGLPFVQGQHKIRIVITPNLSTQAASVGQVCVGFAFTAGVALESAKSEMVDYSRKEFNEFGEVEIIQRGYANRTEYPIAVTRGQEPIVQRILTAYRGAFCVYSPDLTDQDLQSLLNYGILSSYESEFDTSDYVRSTITIDGVI